MTYIIIGNSAAGVAAAKEIRTHDQKGTITMISRDHAFYSRCQLHYLASGYKDKNKIRFISNEWAKIYQVDLQLGKTVTGVDPKTQTVKLASGEQYHYDKLLIATGADSFFPPIPGLQGELTFGFRNIEDAAGIHEVIRQHDHITIIGAGLVGLELATELVKLGKSVTVVELAPHPLPMQLDRVTGPLCLKLLADNNINCICNDRVDRIERNENGLPKEVVLASGRKVETDIVVCAAGVKANTDFLGDTGVEMNKGIVINSLAQTSIDNIYAAGDVTETRDVLLQEIMPSAIWPTAVRQGRVAGANMSGGEESLTKNTGLRASVSLFGTNVISIGPVFKISDSWQQHVFQQTNSKGQGSVRVLYTDGGLLKAAVLWGDVANAGLYTEAVVNKRDISGDMAILDTLDAAKRGQEELSILN